MLRPNSALCAKCHNVKDKHDFSRDSSQDDGYDRTCKTCRAQRQRDYRAKQRSDREAQRERIAQTRLAGTTSVRDLRIQATDVANGRHVIPKPQFNYAIQPQGIVRLAGHLYRVLTVTETHAKLSNGAWVPRHLISAA